MPGWFFNPLLFVKLNNLTMFLASMFLFCGRLPKKERFASHLIRWLLLSYGVTFAMPILTTNVWYVTTVFLVACAMSTLTIKGCYKVSWPSAMLVAAAGFSTQHIASMCDSIVSLQWPDIFSYARVGHPTLAILGNYLFWSVLVYLAVYFLLARKTLIESESDLNVYTCTLFLVVSIFLNLYVNLIHASVAGGSSYWVYLFEYALNILCSLFLLVIQFSIMRTVKTEKRLQMNSMLWEQAREQYRISKENIDAINIKCHDLKHRLLAFKGTADEKEFADIIEAINSYGAEIKTGNEVLDVIFQEKNFQCRKRGIQFTCIIDGAELDFIETTDLYVLFGNMIDNCIEAVSRLPEGEVKNIQVTVRREKGFVLVATENGYTGQVEWADGRLRTSKSDKSNHGYGMLSIESIVKKYHGRYSISTEEQIFSMNIVFPVGTADKKMG